MEDTILSISGIIMGIMAWQIALAPKVEVSRYPAVLTALMLFTTGACYLSLGLILAFASILTSALAWTVISYRSW